MENKEEKNEIDQDNKMMYAIIMHEVKTSLLCMSSVLRGMLETGDYLPEKIAMCERDDEETARLENRLNELQSRQNLQQESDQQTEKNISQLRCYADQMELTEEIKEKLIDKVKVYSDNKIEICWNFESGFFDTKTMHKCG